MPHREMGRGGERGRAAIQMLILLREKRSMVMQRVTPRRTAIRKLQDQRAKDLETGDATLNIPLSGLFASKPHSQ
jgi:hypothetical protein